MIYELKNKNLVVKITDTPLEIISVKYKNKEYIYQKADNWKKQWPICFPWTGKFISNKYLFNNKEYNMNGHGFFRLIDNWKLKSKNSEKIIFTFKDDNQFIDIYPFNFNLEFCFEIKDNILINHFQVTNKSKIDMVYGFGWHPAFLVDKETAEVQFSKKQKIISVPDDTFMDDNLSSKYESSLKVSDFDFSKSNAYFIFNDEEEMILTDKNKELIIDCRDYKYVVFWKTNDDANYFCVEPWASHQDFKGNEQKQLNEKPSVLSLKSDETESYLLKVKFIK